MASPDPLFASFADGYRAPSEVRRAPASDLAAWATARWKRVPGLVAAPPADVVEVAWHARLCLAGQPVPDSACNGVGSWRELVGALTGQPAGLKRATICRARVRQLVRSTEAYVIQYAAQHEVVAADDGSVAPESQPAPSTPTSHRSAANPAAASSPVQDGATRLGWGGSFADPSSPLSARSHGSPRRRLSMHPAAVSPKVTACSPAAAAAVAVAVAVAAAPDDGGAVAAPSTDGAVTGSAEDSNATSGQSEQEQSTPDAAPAALDMVQLDVPEDAGHDDNRAVEGSSTAEAIDEAGSTAAPGPTSPHDDAGSAGSASALVATRGAANPASASPTPRPPDVVAAAGLPTHRAPRVVSPVKKPTPSTDGQATTSAAPDSVGTSDVHEDLATRLAAVGVDFNVTEFRTADAACTVDNLATVLSGEGLAVLARSLLAKLEGAAGSVVASAAAADASSE